MEKGIVAVEVFKAGKLVATAREGIKTAAVRFDGFPDMEAVSMPRVELNRTVLFEHMNGRPLSAFFNGCGIVIQRGEDEKDWQQLEPLFYVHGRSEALRGNVTVTAVVLVKFPTGQEPDPRELLPKLPAIYKVISRVL